MEKVTRDILRNMQLGETRSFDLPTVEACESGKATAYQMQNMLGCKFQASTDYANKRLTLTKSAI